MKTPCPPLENKGSSNALDGGMKDNPGVNTEPDMSNSLATPKPNMKSGYSKGEILGSPHSPTYANKRDPYVEAGLLDDEY